MTSILPKKQKVAKWRKDPDAIEKYQFIHHFLPHKHHKTRAKLLSQRSLTIYCVIFLSILLGIKGFTKVFPGVLGYASDIHLKELLELTNARREDAGLEKLVLNPELTVAAEKKAQDMFKDGYWSHVAPDGTEPWDFILDVGYDYSYAGENLAKNFGNSRDVVDAWYNSPSHRENLLSKNYDEMGLAVVNGTLDGYQTTLVVQMFGRPRDVNNLATAEDQKKILESASTKSSVQIPQEVSAEVPNFLGQSVPLKMEQNQIPALGVTSSIKMLGILFISYLVILILLDVWYSRRHAIAKLSGHSLAHIIFLLMSLVGMLFALMPGKIL